MYKLLCREFFAALILMLRVCVWGGGLMLLLYKKELMLTLCEVGLRLMC